MKCVLAVDHHTGLGRGEGLLLATIQMKHTTTVRQKHQARERTRCVTSFKPSSRAGATTLRLDGWT